MSTQVTIAKAAAAALAGVIALGACAPALAQPAGSYTNPGSNSYNYDPCRRDANQRGTLGAVLGGGAGAVIGSNAAARNARTEGALLGGLLGAIAGGVVGNKTAACTQGPQYSTRYDSAPLPPPPPPAASNGNYYNRDAYADSAAAQARDDAWRDEPRADRYRAAERPVEPDGCTLAESPIYMPDGRTQARFVRVCRDANGKYAVVD
ncbi:MAG: glycine zipper 2TM domain-containing protein [Alphaproteobacteria bacterium]|nr:glycine zipper 2TM domain-containing protein [Alphaproteobacteria bacterium]MBU1514049.1 glycine zipper 2TM domain-containing protein [Alphaproteobacteria bacterium]MBU2093011.1 glycine zipper 2TM domain-containing protein [Alphaproteobacteria bacterium]MBU2151786.1 glycine zipper 2TM domain-containing protein [Alphaproteobacteria bacterium]MBU2309394.1 glycine zipper 2TM domain-containing protein [Alphaproteobacteria bacterium]